MILPTESEVGIGLLPGHHALSDKFRLENIEK